MSQVVEDWYKKILELVRQIPVNLIFNSHVQWILTTRNVEKQMLGGYSLIQIAAANLSDEHKHISNKKYRLR
jgi:hypothetical protein